MSSDAAAGWVIEGLGLGKCYRVYDQPQDRLKQMLWGRWRARPYGGEVWAVHATDLRIARGETVGIIGRNGSGKSTLLQMIAGTLSPTVGEVRVQGRVAALLELGCGFNGEFTGRENVFLAAAIHGMPRSVAEERLTDILAFADIGAFIDQPVKTYSSGMLVRLAFATAIHSDADVLIVDEALAVGDEAFQRKCYARIHSFQEAGGTLLFVSHSSGTVIDLCSRAILIDGGEVLVEGRPKQVVAAYQRLLGAPADVRDGVRELIRTEAQAAPAAAADPAKPVPVPERTTAAWYDPGLVPPTVTSYDTTEARITDVRIENGDGQQVNHLTHGDTYTYSYRVCCDHPCRRMRYGMLIKTITGTELAGATSAPASLGVDRPDQAAGQEVVVRFRWRCLLNPGTYFLNAGVLATPEGEGDERYVARVLDAAMFRVMSDASHEATSLVDLHLGCELVPVGPRERT